MQPLTPKDLLIRHEPVDPGAWNDGDEAQGPSLPPIRLERFQALEHTIRDTPLTEEPYLELARIYLRSSRWTDARRILDQAYDRFPEVEEVCFLREEAQLARSLQLVAEAKAEYEAEPTQLTQEALERNRLELNVLREKVCRARLARHPDRLELNLPLAEALENLGNQAEAIACLQHASAQPMLRAAAALQLGYVFARAQRIPEALSAFRRAALFRVPSPHPEIKLKALNAAADLAQKSHLVDSARRYVRLLIDLQPDNRQLADRLEKLNQMPL